jgi:hypothetical protein
LCKAGKNRGIITSVNEENIANPKELNESYKKCEAVSTTILQGVKPYTAMISTYNRNDPLGGKLVVEADAPLIFK